MKPLVITLCGSTRFTDVMLVKQWELSKQGYITLSWCALPDSYFVGGPRDHVGEIENVKELMDELHLRKIDLSDEVFIVNPGGYIGESTARELAYAREHGKRVRFLEPERAKEEGK